MPKPWGLYLQDSASPIAEGILEVHDTVMFYLIIILMLVGYLLYAILLQNNVVSYKGFITNKPTNFFGLISWKIHGSLLEFLWTLFPIVILLLIAFPSFILLYLTDDVIDPAMTIKCTGLQWYWCAPSNLMVHSGWDTRVSISSKHKATYLPDFERIGECSMYVKATGYEPIDHTYWCQAKSTMDFYKLWASQSLLSLCDMIGKAKIWHYMIKISGYVKILSEPHFNRRKSIINPKVDINGPLKNLGFPKGRNSYVIMKIIGNGYTVLDLIQKIEGCKFKSFHTNSIDLKGSSNNKMEKIGVVDTSINVCYKEMWNKDLWIKAYEKLKSKPGNMTESTDKKTLDGYSTQIIDETILKLKDRSFQFHPSKRIYIPKSNGKLRPLGIPSPRDKIVQEVFRTILNSVYEPLFKNTSHGFRPSRSTKTAIYEIRKWTGITWVIEGDIKGYFDNIDHNKLYTLLAKQIKDKNLLDLYWKLVKAGYVNNGNYQRSNLGVPQGGIISPLLSNIYLHEFDLFMENLIKEFSTDKKKVSINNPEYEYTYRKIRNQFKNLKKYLIEKGLKYSRNLKKTCQKIFIKWKGLKQKVKDVKKMNSTIRTENRIYYNRYADDFVIGIIGDKQFAEMIKAKITIFLKEELLLDLSEEKTKITYAIDGFNYLGYFVKREGKVYSRTLKTTSQRVYIRIPMEKILNKLIDHKFASAKDKPIACTKWIYLSEKEIISRYSAILRGLHNYYLNTSNINQFGHIMWLMKFSCVFTLARKFRISPKEVFKKYKYHFKGSNRNKKRKTLWEDNYIL